MGLKWYKFVKRGLTYVVEFGIIRAWNPAITTVEVKRTVACHPAGAEWRRVYSPCGKYFSKGVIHITLIFGIIGTIGTIASVVSLVIMLHDRRWGQKEK